MSATSTIITQDLKGQFDISTSIYQEEVDTNKTP